MRELNFTALDEQLESNPDLLLERSRRWSRREASTTVQMSVRTQEHVYERFRALCMRERRTNGEMLEILLANYLNPKRREKELSR